jgi:CubicO group peptidase (beta-lactamase class C family)
MAAGPLGCWLKKIVNDMNRRRVLSLLSGALVSSAPTSVSARSSRQGKRTWRSVQVVLDDYVANRRLAGAAVAVSEWSPRLTYLHAGRLARDTGAPFDQDAVCRIYSMTKPITGLAAMLLVEAGTLRLDQPVADVIPELGSLTVAIDPASRLDARAATRIMTMRHLLTHTAGFAYWTPERGTDALSTAYRAKGITPGNYGAGLRRPGYGAQANGLDDMVRRLSEVPLAAEPGTRWRYSVGLDVMGLVIQRVSGTPFDVFARERLFTPLRMHSTGFHVPPPAVSHLTTNYTVTSEGLAPLDPRERSVFLDPPTLLAGGAGLVSTARDFARVGAMLIGDGTLDRVRVMKPETVRLACSNLLPDGVVYDGGGYGAGMRVASGGAAPRDAEGTVSWNGAAGTMWAVDRRRRFNFVFMSQFMPPTSYPIWTEIDAALSRDLA